jgi:20S proteasome subunit beta 7
MATDLGMYSSDGFYKVNGPLASGSNHAVQPFKKTLRPIVTGSSVLGVTFDGGIMLAADTLGSYGSLARYRNLSRLLKVNDTTVAAGSGDYADFQYIETLFKHLNIESESLNDGHSYSPQSMHSWLTRVLYNRRSRFNPLWNTVIIGGYHDTQPFLGVVNSLGVAFEAPTLATGFGSYIAQPLLREAYEKNPKMTSKEAQDVIEKCLTILYYRDARSWNKYEIATITSDGVEISQPQILESNWEVANYVRGYD